MDQEPYIQSRQNEQIKNLIKLRERKHRVRQSKFVVEGLRELEHALAADYEVETIYFCPEYFPRTDHGDFIDARRRSGFSSLIRLSADAFARASYREGPDGLLATVAQQSSTLDELQLPDSPLILVLEGIEKPGNLGAILRSADGAGVDAVVLVDCVLDRYNPNAIRSSQGLIFALPMINASRDGLSEWLREHSLHIVATTPDTEHLHWHADFQRPTALFLGSESDGLSDFWLGQAEKKIRIPMAGRADSLNVAAASAVCLYEAARQRAVAN